MRSMWRMVMAVVSGILLADSALADHWGEMRSATTEYRSAVEELREELEDHFPDPYTIQMALRLERSACELRDHVRRRCEVSHILHSWDEVALLQQRLDPALAQASLGCRHVARRVEDLHCRFDDLCKAIDCFRAATVVVPTPSVPSYRPPLGSGNFGIAPPRSGYGSDYGWNYQAGVGAHSQHGFTGPVSQPPIVTSPVQQMHQRHMDMIRSAMSLRFGR